MVRPRLASPLTLSFLIITAGCLSAAHAQEKPVALVGATVLPVSGAPIQNGTVILQNGKIKAVGKGLPVPADAKRVDARGKVIIPGLIDASSSLFLAQEDLNGMNSADRDVIDGIDWFDDNAKKVVAQGVTTLYLSPGRKAAVTGTGAIVKLRHTADHPGPVRVVKPQAALNITLGTSANNRTSSLERLAAYEALRSAFKAAQQYGDSFGKYDRDIKYYEAQLKAADAAGDDGGDDPFGMGGFGQPQTPQKPNKPRKVPAQEIMLKALKREIPVRIEAHRAEDIRNALRLADEFKLKLILERATNGYQVAGEIAKHRVPVVWGPVLVQGAPTLDLKDHWSGAAASLAKAGVKLALTTDGESGLSSRFLLDNAAAAAGYGLPQADALNAVTLGAAEVLGISDRCGSIAAGKDADIVVMSAEPWSPVARVEQVWIDGEAVYAR